jgi:predicted phage tail protein
MLRKIRLYGELAKVVGERVLYADVRSAAQTASFLISNWPELQKHIADRSYKITVDEWELDETELNHPIGSSDIKIIPVIGGAGGNTGRIILGIAIIGAVVVTGGAAGVAFGAGGALGFGAGAGGAAVTMGASALAMAGNIGIYMVLTGIANALTPVQDVEEVGQDPRRSFSFSGIQNTSRAGVAVPVIYGQVLTGSVVISAGIDTVQVEA